jgi:hypothetical protein
MHFLSGRVMQNYSGVDTGVIVVITPPDLLVREIGVAVRTPEHAYLLIAGILAE